MTRSLGDTAMKEFVVGSPFTTETTIGPDDAFLIVACDGVSHSIYMHNPKLNGDGSSGTCAKTKKRWTCCTRTT